MKRMLGIAILGLGLGLGACGDTEEKKSEKGDKSKECDKAHVELLTSTDRMMADANTDSSYYAGLSTEQVKSLLGELKKKQASLSTDTYKNVECTYNKDAGKTFDADYMKKLEAAVKSLESKK